MNDYLCECTGPCRRRVPKDGITRRRELDAEGGPWEYFCHHPDCEGSAKDVVSETGEGFVIVKLAK